MCLYPQHTRHYIFGSSVRLYVQPSSSEQKNVTGGGGLLNLFGLAMFGWHTAYPSISWCSIYSSFVLVWSCDVWCSYHVLPFQNFPTPRGQPRKAPTKYGVGGLLLFVLIFIIWFPLLLFSLASAVFMAYPPVDCTVQIRIGGYEVSPASSSGSQGDIIARHSGPSLTISVGKSILYLKTCTVYQIAGSSSWNSPANNQ